MTPPELADFVVRVPGRRLFLRREGPRVHHGLVEYADGKGGAGSVELPEGPAFGRPVTYTREAVAA